MRVLGLVICALLLAACTGDGDDSASKPATKALTAKEVLGDFGTADYCTLLDTAGGTPVPSFESCRVDVDGLRRLVGPVQSDTDIGLDPANTRVHEYAGDLPAGVAVREPVRDFGPACMRWVGFSDHLWLLVGVSDSREPTASTAEQRCTAADDLLAGVLEAVTGGPTEHVSYGPDSFGSLDPCRLLDRPEIEEIIGGRGVLEPSAHGHDCGYGHIGLRFRVDTPGTGPQETLAGRQVTVVASAGLCTVSLDRPLPGRPGLVEDATVTGVPASGVPDTCRDARAAAEVLFPDLAQ